MTALRQYRRLESLGIWRPDAESMPREVVVSFGNATLVLSDPATETPLTHWSLPAVTRTNTDALPAIYAPAEGPAGQSPTETLEIADEDMIDAISRVHNAIDSVLPSPKKLRGRLALGAVMLLAAGLIWLLPDWLIRHTVSIAPPAQRIEVGQAVLAEIMHENGPSCRRAAGDIVLARLGERLMKGTPTDAGAASGSDKGLKPKVVVFPNLVETGIALPGGFILIGAELLGFEAAPSRAENPEDSLPAPDETVEEYSTLSSFRPVAKPKRAAAATVAVPETAPEVALYNGPDRLAGAVLAAMQYAAENDPLENALRHAGPAASFGLLTGSNISAKRFSGYGRQVLQSGQPLPQNAESLLQRFKAAGISPLSYAGLLEEGSALKAHLLENDPFKGQLRPRPILSESEWAALQDLCAPR